MKHLSLLAIISFSLIFSCKKPVDDIVPVEATEDIVEMQTPYGNMYIYLYKATPLHRANFLQLASTGYFDSTTFHRVIPGFMIQG
ncbi:MAG: peptidylprolyl isomerase, partial [Chitinophagaceae bacterium]